MKSTKYQLLKGEFEFACQELKMYRTVIDQLRKENERYVKEIKLLSKQAEKLNKLQNAYNSDDQTFLDYLRVTAEVFGGKETPTRIKRV